MSAQPYTREEWAQLRAKTVVAPGTMLEALFATVDLRDAEIRAVQDRACEVEMEWAAKVDARDAALRKALKALLEVCGDRCAKCRVASEDDEDLPFPTLDEGVWYHVGPDFRTECEADDGDGVLDAVAKIEAALAEGGPRGA